MAIEVPGPTPLAADAELPASGPGVLLDTASLSPLYANFFGTQETLRLLSRRLGALGLEASVALEVRWDEEHKAGSITLFVPEDDRTGERLADAVKAGAPVPAQHLGVVMQILAKYRSELAERFDLRILAFGLRLAFWDRQTGSYCSVGDVLNDPKGEQVGPCFRCLVPAKGAQELCRDGEAWPAVITGEKRGLRMLESALRSDPS